MKKHQDKVIVVTGAGRGLGRAYAERLSSEGARVAVAAIDAVAGAHAAEELRKRGMDSTFIETAVSSKEATEAMAARALEKWGQMDARVANTGLANSACVRTYAEIRSAPW